MDIIRIGEVQNTNDAERKVRVYFKDVGIMSGWLKVIKSPPFIPEKDVTQQTESESGGSGYGQFDAHTHKVIISPWMPSVGDIVLCVYVSGFNADGYVLGAL